MAKPFRKPLSRLSKKQLIALIDQQAYDLNDYAKTTQRQCYEIMGMRQKLTPLYKLMKELMGEKIC